MPASAPPFQTIFAMKIQLPVLSHSRCGFSIFLAAIALLAFAAPVASAAKPKHKSKAEAESGSATGATAAPAATGGSAVVRPAPDVPWLDAGRARQPLKKLRGQPVVVIIAPSADNSDFRKQARLLEKRYLDMSARKIVFIAAFGGANPTRVESSIPFVLAVDGPGTAAAFGAAGKFGCVVIGPDGNVDLQSDKVEAAQRILDVVNNSQQPQAAERKGQGS